MFGKPALPTHALCWWAVGHSQDRLRPGAQRADKGQRASPGVTEGAGHGARQDEGTHGQVVPQWSLQPRSLEETVVLSLSVLWGPETAPHRAPRGSSAMPSHQPLRSATIGDQTQGTKAGRHRGSHRPRSGRCAGQGRKEAAVSSPASGRAGFFHQVLCLQQQEAKENKRQERSGTGGTCASGSCKQRRAVNAGRVMDVPEGPRRMCRTLIFPRPARPALPAAAGPTPPVPPEPPVRGLAARGAAGPAAPSPSGQPCSALPPAAQIWLLSAAWDPKGVIYSQPRASPSSPPGVGGAEGPPGQLD